MKRVMKGNIYYANLDPVIGSEQGGNRPVLVVSNNIGNNYSPTIIVAPITSIDNNKSNLPTHVEIRKILKKDSIILLEQLKTIDKTRLTEFKGRIDRKTELQVDKALIVALDINLDRAVDNMIYF